jgi:uncharacterized cupin superfamily protein
MITIEKPTEEKLNLLQVQSWPIWECDPSEFEWFYDEQETCFLLQGKVTVQTDRETVSFGAGDLVTFPAGLSCIWRVNEKVRKHYRFG